MENIFPSDDGGKRSKKIAYSIAEKDLLISLVSKRPIIENKQTNAKHLELKRQAWEEVENAYNAIPIVSKRTAFQLKRCWENIKSNRKKELSSGAAFSSAEKEQLISLMSERPITANKQSDAKTIQLQEMAWKEIENAYNMVPFIHKRTVIELQKCWDGIKSNRKKELSIEAGSLIQTGGGVGEPSTTENVIDSICPHINLTVPGVIDSNTEENALVDLTFIETQGPENISTENKQDIDMKEWPTMPEYVLKKRKRECLSFKPHADNNSKLSNEVQVRMKRCKENMVHDFELHNLRLQREKLLIKKEEIIIEREAKESVFLEEKRYLEIKKIKLEIELLEQKITK